MKVSVRTVVLLASSVLALLMGPVVLLLLLGEPIGIATGLGLLAYGSGALWVGMRALHAVELHDDP